MKTSSFVLFAVSSLLLPGALSAQTPSINANGVVNAASYAGPGSGGTVQIAQGSIAVIYGKNLGPSTLVSAGPIPLSATLAGTSVRFTAGGTGYDAYPIYTYAGQVSVVVPSTVPVGNASVTVTYNGATSAGQTVSIVKASFGIFTKNSGGSGPAVLQNFYPDGTVRTNGLASAAAAGQVLILYGTGLGATTGPDNVAPPIASFATNVTLTVGGQTLSPSYAGRSFYPGLDQINFQLPSTVSANVVHPEVGAGVPAGCYVTFSLNVGTVPSNQATLSIASPGTTVCNHPMGLSASALANLDNGGTVNVGLALAARFGLGYGLVADGAGAAFFKGNANDVFIASIQAANGNGSAAQHGQTGCYTYNYFASGTPSSATVSLSSFSFSQLLDAGASLSLTGPGTPQTLAALKTGGYGTSGASTFLADGNWTLTGNGGADVGAFKANLGIPIITWTNASNYDGQAVPVANDLVVNWTGGNAGDIVAIAGASVAIDINNPANTYDYVFLCYSPATAHTFTVPKAIVSTLPKTPSSATIGAAGVLTVSAANAATFTAPLTKGGQLDGGIFGWGFTDVRGVTWQ